MDLDINFLRSIFTLVSMCIFLVIVGWVYARSDRAEYEKAASLSLKED